MSVPSRYWLAVGVTIAIVAPGVASVIAGGGYWAWPIVSVLCIVVLVATLKWAAKMMRPPDRRDSR